MYKIGFEAGVSVYDNYNPNADWVRDSWMETLGKLY